MPIKPQYFVILVVDIESFGTRPNPVQSFLRNQLYELMEGALQGTGIDAAAGSGPVDRGDGMFWLLPGTVPKTDLAGTFVDRLRTGLRAHAQTSNPAAALRLRVVLASGEVGWDGRGWVGEDLNTACRMVDHQPLRNTLAAAPQAQLVLAISDEWHRSVLRHDYPELESASFHPVRFEAKEIKDATVWVRVPGYHTPPGLAPSDEPEPALLATGGTAAHGAPHEGAPQRTAPAGAPRTSQTQPRAAHDTRSTEMTGQRPADHDRPHVTQTGGTAQMYVGQNDGVVSQVVNGDAPLHADPELLQHIAGLRQALREARAHREVDEETFEGASQALDEATRQAGAGPAGRSRFVLALRSFKGLVEPISTLAAAAAAVIAAVRANGS
ncbi:hypothetical protein [Streptomyces sp. NPDC006879]|uniref:hypothetical protein n=1 Tax=Streptomyces sp. NPDC006879 TaxID=3364767 RepID=UPI0036A3C8AD